MTRFLIRRISQGLFVLVLVTFTIYAIFFLGPGPQQVARVLAGKEATPAQIAAIAAHFELNQPWYVAYGHFLAQIFFHGNLGYDYYNSVPVTTSIMQALPITLSLVVGAAILWLAIGLFTGIVSAVKTRSFADRALTAQALFFYSMPTFVLGLMFIWLGYSVLTNHGVAIFPAPGAYTPITSNPLAWAHDMILPWLTIALVSAATYTRLTRGAMLDVFGEDYIRTARSKGMPERRVIVVHNLRSSLTPVVTQFGLDVGVLLGGAIITETVFSLPGLGWTAIKAIYSQDLPLVMGITIVAAVAVVVLNMLADIMYAVLDPRVRIH